MATRIVTFLKEHSVKPLDNSEIEALANVTHSYVEINRTKKRQQMAFRRFMTAQCPSRKIARFVGCDRDFLRSYIAGKMVPGIHWNNYGSVWVIDHIVPLRLFNVYDPRDLAIVWNYRNLMPLFKNDNLHKEGDTRFSLILLDEIDDGSEVIRKLKERASVGVERMEKYLKDNRLISKAS